MAILGNLTRVVALIAVLLALRGPVRRLFASPEAAPRISTPRGMAVLNLTLFATNDIHSAVTGVGPETLPQNKRGGYARMASVLKKLRQDSNSQYLTVDAGDWYAGSLFDQLGPHGNTSAVPELEYFFASKYDAINIGNHDFDATDRGLAGMMNKAASKGLSLNFVSSNIHVSSGPLAELTSPLRVSNVSLLPYTIKTYPSSLRPIRIGIMGLFGPDAALCSVGTRGAATFTGFNDTELKKHPEAILEHAAAVVTTLREIELVDFVVVLLHGGPDEARELATAVHGIDIIASGHTHESYYLSVPSLAHDAVTAQDTHVVQCGHSGRSLGMMKFAVDADLKIHLTEQPACVEIDATHDEDIHVQQLVRNWQAELPHVLNSSFAYEQVVFRGQDGFLLNSSHNYLQHAHAVSNLLLTEVNRRLTTMGHAPADVYLTCPTCVRTRAHSMDGEVVLQYSDVYKMLSISTTCDMVVFHMRKEDLWMVLNIVVILGHVLSDTFVLTLGGVEYDASSWGIPFINYFKNLRLTRADGSALPYEEWPALVRVVTSTYIGKHIWKAKKLSYGFVPTPARDHNGDEISMAASVVSFLPAEYKLLADHLHSRMFESQPITDRLYGR